MNNIMILNNGVRTKINIPYFKTIWEYADSKISSKNETKENKINK